MTLIELAGVPDWAEPLLAGERGLALLLLVVAFAPLPSEVVLPVAGFLARQGAVSYALVLVVSVLGAYVLALVLYLLGARVGLQRSITALSKLPLIHRADMERAARWFETHGRLSVFFGRLLPGLRTFVALPAGAVRMPLIEFSSLTLAGAALWNGLLIGIGAALGSQYQLVQRYASMFNYAAYVGFGVFITALVVRRLSGRGSNPRRCTGGTQ